MQPCTAPTNQRNMNIASPIQEGMQKLGLSYLKDKQGEAVETFLRGEDTVVALPTGYGKITNICYSTICI